MLARSCEGIHARAIEIRPHPWMRNLRITDGNQSSLHAPLGLFEPDLAAKGTACFLGKGPERFLVGAVARRRGHARHRDRHESASSSALSGYSVAMKSRIAARFACLAAAVSARASGSALLRVPSSTRQPATPSCSG